MMKEQLIHFTIPEAESPEEAFRSRRERDRQTHRHDEDGFDFGSMLRLDVRPRLLFANVNQALMYCMGESIWDGPGLVVAVRYADDAVGLDMPRRLREAPRRWLIAGWGP